jgi:hypothetical protein
VTTARQRWLGIDVNDSSARTYAQAFAAGRAAGMNVCVLNLDWNAVEVGVGVYDSTLPDIANTFYPSVKTPLALTLTPINTTHAVFPYDLQGQQVNHPAVIERFARFTAYVLQRIPDVKLVSVILGNELDANVLQISELYRAFIREVRAAAPRVPVGVEMTFDGLAGVNAEQLAELNKLSDIIAVSHYPTGRPPGVIHADFAFLATVYPGKPIHFMQIGYPSSRKVGSSRMKQARFVAQAFAAWDARPEVALLNFEWMHDISPEAVTHWSDFYGASSAEFAAFIGSIGLCTNAAKAKPAWDTLVNEARSRGFAK